MRVIGGFLKGKKIDFMKSATTRPLRDFVKENIFNILNHSNLIDISLEDASVLDLYSGVGSFGIECISRGAKKTTFVESDKIALETLKNNIEQLKIEKKSRVFGAKTNYFFNQLNENDKFEIIFLDPPFSEDFFIEELKLIKKTNIFNENHIVIIHREGKSNDNFLDTINVISKKKYGRSKIIFGHFKSNTA